jgi:hypothetical protein
LKSKARTDRPEGAQISGSILRMKMIALRHLGLRDQRTTDLFFSFAFVAVTPP